MTQIDFCYYHGCDKHPSPTGPPKDPTATFGQLRNHQNNTLKWEHRHTRIADAETQSAIVKLIDDSQNWEELYRAYRIAELAGMVYFHLSDKAGESEWVG